MIRPALITLLALGCTMVRPVSLTPPLPVAPPEKYVVEASPPPAEPPAASPAPAPPNEGAWWTAFGDPALGSLIQEALARNFTLRDLRGLYHEDLLVKEKPNGPLWPLQIGIPGLVQRARNGFPPALGFPAYSLVNNEASLGVAASYQIDVWGQLAVQQKVFDDLAEIQAHSAEVGAQDVAVQVAQVWFDILAQRALLQLFEEQVKLNEGLQGLVQGRFELHLTPRLAVLQQEQVLLNTRAQVPLVQARLAMLGSQLASLLARPPAQSTDLVPRDRGLPELPPQPALGAPANLVKTSPEVRMAQRRVAEAEHRVSQNLSSWLPVVNVFANGGMRAFDLHNPLNFEEFPNGTSILTWSFGARLTWPIFDGGQRQTEASQLTLTVRRRNMLYQQAFFEAVRRVQDAQMQEAKQADNVRTLQAEVELGKRVLTEARQVYERGNSDYLPVLTALSNLSDLERALIAARRILVSHRIELYRALGGTWSRETVDVVD